MSDSPPSGEGLRAPDPPPVVVLGGSSVVGPDLLRRLAEAGYRGFASSRRLPGPEPLPEGFEPLLLDPAEPGPWRGPEGALVFSLIPLPALQPLLVRLSGAAQIVALSTSSVHVKGDSDDPAERATIKAVLETEARLAEVCAESGCHWTVLRPTLVYKPGRDLNVSALARFIRRFGFLPIAAPGRGLRQPVHADDVAAAALAAIGNVEAFDRAFLITGGETLTYRDMVARIFEALGRRPRILPLPVGLLRLAMTLARPLLHRAYSPALFERMNRDLAFEDGDAARVLGLAPRPFHPDFPA